MKAVTKKTNEIAENIKNRLREGGLIVISFIALFLLLALVTYHISDPGWSNSGQDGRVLNSGGQVGAWLADFLLYFFGYFAYLFPLLMLGGAWLFYREHQQEEISKLIKLLRFIGFISVLIAGCGLAGIYLNNLHAHLPLTAGGVLGQIIAPNLDIIFNKAGATLFLLALLLIGITLFSGLSWLAIVKYTSHLSLMSLRFLRELFGDMLPKRQLQLEIEPAFKEVKNRQRASQLGNDNEDELIQQDVVKMAVTEKSSAPTLLKKAIVNKPAEKTIPSKPALATAGGLPPLELLEAPSKSQQPQYSPVQLEALSNEVELRLKDFGIQAQVVAVHPGPVVTRFELQLAPGIKASRVTGLSRDLARSLSKVSVRVVEVIPGKSVIGLEIPNDTRDIVYLQELLQSRQYTQATSPLSLALGKDIAGYPVVVDLAKMPHLLVAGTTGSGKSVSLNTMLLSLLFKATPQEVRLIMIDPKMLELSVYEGIPHLLTPVVTDMKEAANALRWCVAEMDRRYRLMAAMGVRNLAGFNKKVQDAITEGKPLTDPLAPPGMPDAPLLQPLSFIVVLIDEFADMMMVVGKKVEDLIARIAQKARAAGIHMILATQRPSVDVITGLIKANIPTRIAFQVSSKIDSRTILDQQGAENLLGNGDMLYMPPGTGMPVRVHGVYASDDEVHRVVADWKLRGEPDYLPDILQEDNNEEDSGEGESANSGERDPLYDQAVRVVTETRRASISLVQRKLRIGYNRAATMLEEMQNAGIVSAMENNGTREVLAPPPVAD